MVGTLLLLPRFVLHLIVLVVQLVVLVLIDFGKHQVLALLQDLLPLLVAPVEILVLIIVLVSLLC